MPNLPDIEGLKIEDFDDKPDEGETLDERIGGVFRERRHKLKKKLHTIAQRAGISIGFLSAFELGKCRCSINTLAAVSKALDIKLWQLLQVVNV